TETLALGLPLPLRTDAGADPLALMAASQILMPPADAAANPVNDYAETRVCEQGGILATVGNTPMVRLHRALGGVPFRLMAKLESANPGGSIKDRSAQQIIES